MIMKLLLLALLLSSCATDRTAGANAAAMLGERTCVQFERGGVTDTAAVFPFRDEWWFYHPAFGSVETNIPATSPAPLWCRAATKHLPDASNIRRVPTMKCEPGLLGKSCLPSAIYLQRTRGGSIVAANGHAQWIPDKHTTP